MKDFIDITKIDINKIDLLCQKNILSYVVELYEKNYNTHQIEKMTKLSKSQICRLLNKANDLELIHYNKYKFKQESTKKAQITLYQNNAKPIKCLENSYVFGTCTIAAKNSEQIFGKKMLMTTIYNAINNKKTAYGYKFVFITRDEFNSTKTEHPNMAFGDYFKSLIHNNEVA